MGRRDVDVVIVGGGMIGAALAAALADDLVDTPLSVALVDAGPAPAPPPDAGYDLRVSAVSPGTRSILEAAGAWGRMNPERIGPYHSMHVWDAASSGAISFDAAELGEPWLGYIIENSNIQNALLESIAAAGNIEQRFDTRPETLEVAEDHCRLVMAGGGALTAGLVVGADGAHSWVREQLGIAQDRRLYGQRAFVCEAATEQPHRHTAWQRFLPSGPVAFLPLANGHASVVWTCDAALAAELTELDADAFAQRLEAAFEARLGGVTVTGPVRSFDLSRRRAERYVTERGALIGDAAHVVHPLAGQGANLGFADAWSLAQVLRDAADRDRDIGRSHVLRPFERWRRSENASMMQMLDALHGLFSTDSGLVGRTRGFGLNIVDRQGWIKRLLARRALGRRVPGDERRDPAG